MNSIKLQSCRVGCQSPFQGARTLQARFALAATLLIAVFIFLSEPVAAWQTGQSSGNVGIGTQDRSEADPLDSQLNLQTEGSQSPQNPPGDEAGSDSKRESKTKIIGSKSLLQVFQNGGPLMVPIGVCSFVLLAFIFERFVSLRRGRIIPRPFVKRILEQIRDQELTRDEAISLCQKNGSSVAVVFEAALQRWDRPTVEVEQAIIDSGERVTNGLRRYLRLINGIATVCPLLGLLGTVLGMIHAFDAIALTESQARPEVTIAVGISQALLTTAAGLSVAIPALITYLFFVGRVDRLVVEIDALGQRLVSLIASDAYRPQEAETTTQRSTSKTTRKTKRAA